MKVNNSDSYDINITGMLEGYNIKFSQDFYLNDLNYNVKNTDHVSI